MYSANNFRHGPRRQGGTRHFGPKTRYPKRGGGPGGKQNINPERFIKKAGDSSVEGYIAGHDFADFAIHPILKANVAAKGFLVPSEIQEKTIPLGLAGRDVVGIANTGTGKTAAFALPILDKLLNDRQAIGLIVTPTRELAVQIEDQCRQFAKNSGLSAVLLIGGMPMGKQLNALKNRPRLIIGTPGRIKDHTKRGTLNLGRCNMVVLDEVDRMLDMGFINDVRYLLNLLPANRQSFFFSATINPGVSSLIAGFTHDPVTIDVKVGETSDSVHQDVIKYIGKTERLSKLHDVLLSETVEKVLIFGDTKYGVDRLAKELQARGFKVEALHGGKSQNQRQRALDSFRENRIHILVATEVAARGIDVADISHVINFDVPKTYDDYIHRIGRAGRAGKTGHALTFVEGVDHNRQSATS